MSIALQYASFEIWKEYKYPVWGTQLFREIFKSEIYATHIDQKLVESSLQVQTPQNSNQTGHWTSVLLSSFVSIGLRAIVQHIYIGRKILQKYSNFLANQISVL